MNSLVQNLDKNTLNAINVYSWGIQIEEKQRVSEWKTNLKNPMLFIKNTL